MRFFRPFLITLIGCLLPLASVVVAQCPYQGWTVSGSCQITGYCVDPREQCQYRSVCCRISGQQITQTTKQNPKTGTMETNYCPLGSYRDGGCSSWCWTPSQVCVNRQDCCVKTNIPVNENAYDPNNPGGTNPYNNNNNIGGFNPYNPGMGADTCRQGQCPLTMCQDGSCSIMKYCYDQNASCFNGVCCYKGNNAYNPYPNNNNNNNYNPNANSYNNNPYSNGYNPNTNGYNPYSNGYNYPPTNNHDRDDPTVIVINTSPTAGTSNGNPSYPYNSNNLYNGYNPNNNGYNPNNNGYSNNNGYNPNNNGYPNNYNPNNNGYNPYNNGYSNNNGYNPNNNGYPNNYNPYNNGFPNNNGYSNNNGYNPNNNRYSNNNGYNPNNNGYSNNNGYNPNNNGYSNGYNPYNNGYNTYSNNNNNNDCSTASMVPDQAACNSMQGQCTDPLVAQTCRQMCCNGQYANVGTFPQMSGR